MTARECSAGRQDSSPDPTATLPGLSPALKTTVRFATIKRQRRSVAQFGQSAGLQNQWSRVRILPLLPTLDLSGPRMIRGCSFSPGDRQRLSLPAPFPPSAFPSQRLSLPAPFPPSAFPSQGLSLPAPFPPRAFPSQGLSLPGPFPPRAFPSQGLSLPGPFPPRALPSQGPSLPGPFPPRALPLPGPFHGGQPVSVIPADAATQETHVDNGHCRIQPPSAGNPIELRLNQRPWKTPRTIAKPKSAKAGRLKIGPTHLMAIPILSILCINVYKIFCLAMTLQSHWKTPTLFESFTLTAYNCTNCFVS